VRYTKNISRLLALVLGFFRRYLRHLQLIAFTQDTLRVAFVRRFVRPFFLHRLVTHKTKNVEN